MENFKVLHSLLGSKLRFKCSEAEYEGILQYLTPRRLTMEHVYYLPNREYMGCLDYDLHEIRSFSVIESKDTIRKYERFDYLANLFSRSYSTNNYNVNDVLFNDELDEISHSDDEVASEHDIKEEEFILKLPSDFQDLLPKDSVILEVLNTEFDEAITCISKHSVIGVSFEGPKISRFGKLSWICISTTTCVFLFDIEVLQNKAFDRGLRNIFQDKNIEKVIHDCRQPADCLSHLFSTDIKNVFDTQVADYIISMQRYTDKYNFKYVSSIDCCLMNHLGIPQEFLRNRKKHFSYEDELNFFSTRPISNEYRNMIIKNAVYLLLLKKKLSKLLMEPFYKAVGVYLNVLSNASDAELQLDVSVPDMIPPAILMKGLQTVRFQEVPAEKLSVPLSCKFIDPSSLYTEQSIKFPSNNSVQNFEGNEKEYRECNMNENLADNVCNNEKEICPGIDDSENEISTTKKDEVISFQDETKVKALNKNFPQLQLSTDSCKNKEIKSEIIVKDSCMQSDRIYYHHLNHKEGVENPFNVIDVKPSSYQTSKFTLKQSVYETDNENSILDNTNNSVNSDVWAVLRAAFSDSSTINNSIDAKKLHVIPAGMDLLNIKK